MGVFGFSYKIQNPKTMTLFSSRPNSMTVTTQANAFNLSTGPAGRAMAQPMDTSLVDALQAHLTLERNASAAYFAIAIWFAERELRGFARFFKQESTSEQIHASNFADYLIARGQTVTLHDIPAPRQSWDSIEEIIASCFQMEAEVTTSLQQIYAMAERFSDTRTTVFLDPTIDNQVASENEFAHILGRVRFAENQPSALLIIDGELEAGKNDPAKLA